MSFFDDLCHELTHQLDSFSIEANTQNNSIAVSIVAPRLIIYLLIYLVRLFQILLILKVLWDSRPKPPSHRRTAPTRPSIPMMSTSSDDVAYIVCPFPPPLATNDRLVAPTETTINDHIAVQTGTSATLPLCDRQIRWIRIKEFSDEA